MRKPSWIARGSALRFRPAGSARANPTYAVAQLRGGAIDEPAQHDDGDADEEARPQLLEGLLERPFGADEHAIGAAADHEHSTHYHQQRSNDVQRGFASIRQSPDEFRHLYPPARPLISGGR